MDGAEVVIGEDASLRNSQFVSFVGNAAFWSGGGIFVDSAKVAITTAPTLVFGNSVSHGGTFVYVGENATILLSGALSLSNNTAALGQGDAVAAVTTPNFDGG